MSSSDGHADSGDEGSWPVRCRHTAYVERSLLQGAAARSIPGGSQALGLKCHELPAAPWLVQSGAGGAGGVALLAALCWHWDFDCPEAAAQVLDAMHFFPEFVWLRSVSVAAQAALCGERGCSLRGTPCSSRLQECVINDCRVPVEMEKPRWATLHSFISRRTEGHGVIQGDQSWEDADL